MKPLAPVIAKVLPILRWGTALQSSGEFGARSSNFLRPTRANLARGVAEVYHDVRRPVRRYLADGLSTSRQTMTDGESADATAVDVAAVANLAGGWVCERLGVVPITREALEAELPRLRKTVISKH